MRNHNKAGISTTEFIICVPILIVFFFIMPFLSDMLDAQQDLAIASRNMAQESQPPKETFSSPEASSMSASDISERVSYNQKEQGNESSTYNKISEIMGHSTAAALSIVNSIKDLQFAGQSLFPTSMLERKSVTLQPTDLKTKYQNLLFNSLSWLGGVSPAHGDKGIFTEQIFKLQLRTSYVRRDGGFHPNDYKYQALVGFFLAGKEQAVPWWDPATRASGAQTKSNSSFINQCSMHFMANDKCERKGNWFAFTTRTVLVARSVIAVIQAVFSAGSNEVAANVQKELTKKMIDEAVKSGQKAAEDYITDRVTQEIKGAINSEQLYRSLKVDKLQESFEDKLNNGEAHLEQNLGGVIAL